MDNSTVLTTVRKYKKLLAKHMTFEKIILYGSQAKGRAHANSDIDVAVIVKNDTGDFFSTRPLLWKIRREVDDRIEPVLIDKNHDESGFLNEIMKTGIII